MSAIKVENFVKTFDNEYKLFDNLNLEIGEREIIGRVRTSGCGKSNRISTVVIITHDIEEAVYLCDKLFVFRKNEEQAMTEIKIESERPRKRGDSYLVELRASILELLKLEPEFEI